MSKIKKSVSIFLAVLMLISVFTVVPFAANAETNTSGDWEYTILDDGTAETKKYLGSDTAVTIPKKLDSYTVTSIGYSTFKPNDSHQEIKSVIIPDNITRINNCAFQYSHIESIKIPGSVKSIGVTAFWNCWQLNSVVIEEGVKRIEDAAFQNTGLNTQLIIPDSVESIGGGAFLNTGYYNTESNWDNEALYIGKHLIDVKETVSDSFSIKEGTISIAGYAFYNCKSLNSIKIPDSVLTIGKSAFRGCVNLNKVSIGCKVKTIEQSAFCDCVSVNSVLIPTSVESIEVYAFGYLYYENKIDDNYEMREDFKIKGYNNTAAQRYAEANGFEFIDLEQEGTIETDAPNPTETFSQEPTVSESEPLETTEPFVTNPTESVTDKETEASSEINTDTPTEKPTESPKTDSFNWGTDNYNFNNSAPDYFKDSTYRAQINNTYLKKLKSNLTNSEYQVIFDGEWDYGAWLDDEWGGSCYGMSSTSLLAKQGLLPFDNYKAGATKLNDLNAPKNDLELSSLITYYQMLQVKDVIQQQYRTVPNKSNETNIKKIISTLDKNPTALIGFQQDYWGGHAILATGYEYGSWTWDKVSYQGCIKICDPNASMGYDKEFNIYFNTSSYNWTIPGYSVIKSTLGAKFNYIGANVNEINKGGYLSGNSGNKVSDYVARINALKISNNRSVSKVKGTNGNYTTLNASPGEIVEDYAYILGNESEGIIGYNLYDADSAYKVTQDNAQNMQLNIDYDNCRMSGGSQAGKAVIFDKKGVIEVLGESAEYNMSMTFDEDYPTDWFTMTISGEDSDNAVLKKTDEGYILKADKLKNVVVKANNRENSASTMFSTDYDSAFIYEINEKVIGIKVDTDNDGIYDSDIDTVEAPTQESKPVVTAPITTEPLVTEPITTIPIVTDPISTDPSQSDSSKKKVTTKKNNPINVAVKAKTIKLKKLKKKAQKVKAIKVKNNIGKVTYKLVKKGITKKIRKLCKINSKGVITIKKWKKAKKGTYKIKVKVTAAGNSNYNAKAITKTIRIKIK